MKAVILAAGRGSRMGRLTESSPKPLLKINDKPILDYIFEALPNQINEVVVVTKYLGQQIQDYLGSSRRGRKIRYVEGSEKGSAYSFLATEPYLASERFLFIQGDEVPDPIDVKKCVDQELSVLTFESNNPQAHGIGFLREDGSLQKIIEKPQETTSNLGISGVMVLNADIFSYKPELVKGEYYFSTMVGQFVEDHKVFPVRANRLIRDMTTPDDLVKTGKILKTTT